MLIAILLFNFMLFGLDAVVLMWLWRYPGWLSGLLTATTVAGSSLFLAVALGGRSFSAFHLLAYGLMLHLPLVLLIGGGLCWAKRRSASVAAILLGLVGIAIAIDATLIEPHWLEVTRHSIASDHLRAVVRVAIVADLQTDELSDYEKSVFERIKVESPDMILFAGDYLQMPWEEFDELSEKYREFFQQIDLRAPLGVYAVGGNVDHAQWPSIFEGLPVEVVQRTSVFQAGDVQVTGLSMRDSFNTNLRVPPATDQFHIVVGHSPDYVLGDVKADLLVAGHTHGGQVQIPGFGPLLTLSRIPRQWCYGRTDLADGRTLIVSRGIGMERGTSPRLRFCCRPELIFVDLVPEEASSAKDGLGRVATDRRR